MAPATIPITEPTRAIAGDTWRWDIAFAGYTPAAGWALTYVFAGAGKLTITAAANAAQTGWEVTVPASSTSALVAGQYVWVAQVTQATEKYTVAQGSTTVERNLAIANAGDAQSHAERTLQVIEAAIENRLTDGMEKYEIDGRVVERIPALELYALRDKYRAEVLRLRNRGRLPSVRLSFGAA